MKLPKNKLPTVRELYEEMVAIQDSYRRTDTLTVSEFTKILRNFVGSEEVKVVASRSANVDLNQVIVNGNYDPLADQLGERSITLTVSYNPDQKTVRFRDVDWPQVCIDVLECAGHELVLQQLYRMRDFDVAPTMLVSKNVNGKSNTLREFLGHPDEIEANGYSIAAEVYLKWAPRALNSKVVALNPIFKAYCSTFGVNHAVVRKLITYSSKYFDFLNITPGKK